MRKVLGLQIDIAWQDRAANHLRVRELLAGRQIDPGSLLVLPEMFDVGFTMKSTLANDDLEGETHRFCAHLAKSTGCGVLAGFARSHPRGGVANVATFFDESGHEIARSIAFFVMR